MTGNITALTNINTIKSFHYYYKGEPNPRKIVVEEVIFEKLTEFKRRSLMYPYLSRNEESPFAVAFFESFNAIKLFIPKNVEKVVPLNINDEELEGVEGVFFDPSNPESMFEFNIDKYLVLLESSLGEDLTNYFLMIHENSLMDGHKEDFELIPNNFQEMSLVNKYLIELRYRTEIVDKFDGYLCSPDTSITYLGEPINKRKHDGSSIDIISYNKGRKIFGFFIKDNFSLNYLGTGFSYGEDLNYKTELCYAKFLKEDEVPTKEHGCWGKFKFKPIK